MTEYLMKRKKKDGYIYFLMTTKIIEGKQKRVVLQEFSTVIELSKFLKTSRAKKTSNYADFLEEHSHDKIVDMKLTHLHKLGNLRQMRSLPYEAKIVKSKLRIQEWYDHFDGDVAVSVSGKDSLVVLHLVRSMYPNVKAVFSNTGLEYPEIVQFITSLKNVDVVRPKKTFKQVVERYGYPVVSKEQSHLIERIRKGAVNPAKGIRLANRNQYLLDAPFKISAQCCQHLKKEPLHKYCRDNKVYMYTGMRAEESSTREMKYLSKGCNAFNQQYPISSPISFWSEQDVLRYCHEQFIQIPSVYGKIVKEKGVYRTTKLSRTGCMFCMYGIQFEKKAPNRFQSMKLTHPKLWEYCIFKLKLNEVLDFMKIPY